ncbi:MAG: DegT/DnrJ/EryC1/StrS family aminotransferase [Acidobacteria bacterium]|nr:DegT/DnrJ/EryC1/StrS family aminotransferase [Acidobacteriota bacterium]
MAQQRATTPAPAAIPFARPAFGDAELTAVVDVLASGWLTSGPRVQAFERAFEDAFGVPHAVATNSCTAALHLGLILSDVGAGDEVITTPLTFCATVNVIVHTGATPVLADIDPITWNLDPDAAQAAITPRTRALLPVHYAGAPLAVSAFQRMARRAGVRVIEDAAHGLGTVSDAGVVGTTADFTAFSFYATKNLSTGEGGMLTTADGELAARARTLALHGMSRDAWKRYGPGGRAMYDVVEPGFKYNMMDIQAALGLEQLRQFAAMQARRAEIWRVYDEGLADLPLRLPAPVADGTTHAHHLFTVLVVPEVCGCSRDDLAAALAEAGISTSIHFRAIHLFSYYAERYGFRRGQFPQAEFVSDHTLSLPLSAAMTPAEAERVVETIRRRLGA